MKRVMRVEEIQKRLQFMRSSAVAKTTGMSIPTVNDIKSGANKNPIYRVLVALSDFLDDQQAPIKEIGQEGGDK